MKKNTMKTKRQSVAASRRRKKIDRVSEAAVVSTILVPVDFSIQSSKALHYACTLAKAFGARLHLLHVNEAVVDAPALASAFPVARAEQLRRLADFAADFRKFRFDQTAQQLVDWGVKVDLSKAREVAYEVGFRSLTHFNRIFRRLVGQSPTVYRRGAKKPG